MYPTEHDPSLDQSMTHDMRLAILRSRLKEAATDRHDLMEANVKGEALQDSRRLVWQAEQALLDANPAERAYDGPEDHPRP